jgi:site-specific recombinase XerD
LALWRESQKAQGTVMTYDDTIRQLLNTINIQQTANNQQATNNQVQQTLNQIVRQSRLPRHKVISLLARLIRFGTVRWKYVNQQFLFSLA